MGLDLGNTDDRLVKHRRRMRGIATFFMVVFAIGGLGVLVLMASDAGPFSDADLFGRLLVVIGGIFGAFAAWHSSRIGALSIVLLQIATPFIGLIGAAELSATDWLRSVVYIALAIVMFISAMRYVSESVDRDQEVAGNGLFRWIGKGVSGAIIAVLGLGIAVIVNDTSLQVLKGSEISEQHREWLVEKSFLLPDEKPLYFYANGAFSIEDGGSLLTNKYVGVWWKEEGELTSYWTKLGEICEVEVRAEGNWIEDAVYRVHSPGPDDWLDLWLSVEGDQHQRFVSRMKTINNRNMRPEVQKFCDENRHIDWGEVAASNGISSDIVSADEVSESQREWLKSNNFLFDEETILSFYSYGIFSIEDGGALLTDQYFGGWYTKDGELGDWWGELGSICSITRKDSSVGLDRALYHVVASDEAWIDMSLPKSGESVDDFIQQTLSLNQAATTEAHQAACASIAVEADTVD